MTIRTSGAYEMHETESGAILSRTMAMSSGCVVVNVGFYPTEARFFFRDLASAERFAAELQADVKALRQSRDPEAVPDGVNGLQFDPAAPLEVL